MQPQTVHPGILAPLLQMFARIHGRFQRDSSMVTRSLVLQQPGSCNKDLSRTYVGGLADLGKEISLIHASFPNGSLGESSLLASRTAQMALGELQIYPDDRLLTCNQHAGTGPSTASHEAISCQDRPTEDHTGDLAPFHSLINANGTKHV
jgi:hypothetical protein